MARMDPTWIEIFNGTTGTGQPFPCNNADQITVEYQWKDDTSAGGVTLEWSAIKSFTGTWIQLDTQTASDNVKQDFTHPGPLGFIRIRMTTNASGGADPGLIARLRRKFSS